MQPQMAPRQLLPDQLCGLAQGKFHVMTLCFLVEAHFHVFCCFSHSLGICFPTALQQLRDPELPRSDGGWKLS